MHDVKTIKTISDNELELISTLTNQELGRRKEIEQKRAEVKRALIYYVYSITNKQVKSEEIDEIINIINLTIQKL